MGTNYKEKALATEQSGLVLYLNSHIRWDAFLICYEATAATLTAIDENNWKKYSMKKPYPQESMTPYRMWSRGSLKGARAGKPGTRRL